MKNRRSFIKQSLAATAALAALPGFAKSERPIIENARQGLSTKPSQSSGLHSKVSQPMATAKFSVIGLNHGHIYGQTEAMIRGGGQLVAFYAKENDLAEAYAKKYPDAKRASSEKEVLEDSSIQLIVSASIPADRAPLGIEVMKHGKDFLVDKPGITTLKQLAEVRKVQRETKRIYSVMYSERFENRATVKAGELVKSGAIGQVIQTIGMGPHRINLNSRPQWFFDKKYFGGIICDIGSHQCDQFLFFTGSTKADVVASQTGNVHYPQYPNFEDFGDMMVRGDGGTGYIRVDWFTPDGLNTWGDGRLTIMGTDGYIELRKNVDIASGHEGGNHLFLVDKKETRYFDCSKEPLPFGELFISDVANRTNTAMTQEHCFLATELALKAQENAQKLVLKK
jgi:predicted dehydrogenase